MSATECDGNSHNGTGVCPREAVWQLKVNGGDDWVWGACARHLSQMGTYLLEGERGELIIRRIKTVE